MSYTKIAKPTSTSYLVTNPVGKQTYDESSISYDDSLTYYDGVNQSLYTNLNKPSSTTYTNIAKPT